MLVLSGLTVDAIVLVKKYRCACYPSEEPRHSKILVGILYYMVVRPYLLQREAPCDGVLW